MASGLIDRIATWLRAEAHGALESVEERALLAKQHLRDAELELLQKRARLDALGAEETRVREAARRLGGELARLDQDVALALGAGKGELARFALRRLLGGRKEQTAFEAEAAQLADARERLAALLAEQEAELARLRTATRGLLARSERIHGSDVAMASALVTDEEIELELLRRSSAREDAR